MRNMANVLKNFKAKNTVKRPMSEAPNSRLVPLSDFGSNPGNLSAWQYVPDGVPAYAPLVVVLHGCTQTAAEYDIGSGWSEVADKHGFALLFPEQRKSNNPRLCFNWFSPVDIIRGQGEVMSINQMVSTMFRRHSLDRSKTFITGLSAGGAMAGAMMATYPELFGGGAIIAGLPYATASTVSEAFARMRGRGVQESDMLADRVRNASDHKGPWPSVSVWHGTADRTVDPVNMEAIIAQWYSLHAIERPPTTGTVDGHSVRRWRNAEGVAVIKAYSIKDMAHGVPIQTSGLQTAGSARAFMLDVGISSTWHIAKSWDLIQDEAVTSEKPHAHGTQFLDIVIEKAIRAVGLIR